MEKSVYELFELRKNHKRKKPSTFLKNSKTAAQKKIKSPFDSKGIGSDWILFNLKSPSNLTNPLRGGD
jgi:hypothetical protein